ncbi:glycosyltransferase [Georgenia sp. EYE_87]|uniref:glycosyltransferase family protein n=1 Tax=Georgenia sp. EYE_87 TaxID=2853448 RepID=UPI002005C534|nr:glycosyltransferase [Georgenia sp. EYE_87]MCK6211759.1 glycosyltransferase [Georgenia sp. EYE_87]
MTTARDRPTMVFHAPYAIDPNPTSASRLRPLRMRDAFGELGYDVIEVTGRPGERRAALRALRQHLRAGGRVDFLYSESSTMPNALGTSVRQGFPLLLEPALWRLCRAHGVPYGVFYRDVYWRFETSMAGASWWWSALLQVLYRFDLLVYRLARPHFFLPSEHMAPVVPVPPRSSFTALPPGSEVRDSPTPRGLSLFYVGGIGGDYDLRVFVRAVGRLAGLPLTMCVPPAHWERARQEYEPLLGDATAVVYARSDRLDVHYEAASVAVLYLQPTEYRRFAVPVKLFEYLGRGRPVIASEGTLAGDIVRDSGAGWVLPYDEEALAALLERLRDAPEEVAERAAVARRVREDHTWRARAAEVARVLAGEGALEDQGVNER